MSTSLRNLNTKKKKKKFLSLISTPFILTLQPYVFFFLPKIPLLRLWMYELDRVCSQDIRTKFTGCPVVARTERLCTCLCGMFTRSRVKTLSPPYSFSITGCSLRTVFWNFICYFKVLSVLKCILNI